MQGQVNLLPFPAWDNRDPQPHFSLAISAEILGGGQELLVSLIEANTRPPA
jgi:hypothetical protein